MKKLILLLVLFLCTGVLTLMAQTRTITGTVTSAVEGEGPIPGVSVTVPGTTIGVFTDANGKYSLNVPQNAKTMVFSFIGMKTQEAPVTAENRIDIVMDQDLLNLDEIIVTGVAAGTPKKKMAVSVERIDASQLKEVTAGSASSALQGKVSGLTVINANGAARHSIHNTRPRCNTDIRLTGSSDNPRRCHHGRNIWRYQRR